MTDGGTSPKDIGKRIVALREALGYNQAQFAELVGLTQPAMSNYEKGFRRPDIDSAIKIQLRTGATLDWLYMGKRDGLPAHLLEKLPILDEQIRKAG
jgi:Predicted transcriptional regulators